MQDTPHYISVTLKVDRADEDESGFVAFCPDLGLSSEGETVDEALTNITEAVEEFLATLTETGDLQTFLRERGIQLYDHRPQNPLTTTVRPHEVVSALVAPVA
jgi:predicted RNase H-like HicB family nuclease